MKSDTTHSGHPAPPTADGYEIEVSRLLIGVALSVISIAFVAAGIAWPQAAGSLLRLMLAIVALVYVAGRAWRGLMHVRTGSRQRSPFDGIVTKRPPPVVPQAVRRLAAQFGGAADVDVIQRRPIPWPMRRSLAGETARRLAGHHGLDLNDPLHHARIRSLVSESTQLLVLGETSDISLSRLNEILDDMERL